MLPTPDPEFAGTTRNGRFTNIGGNIDEDWETIDILPEHNSPASILRYSCDSLLGTVTYTLETKQYGVVQRDASEIQLLLEQLNTFFPTTSFPTLPQREWGNSLRSIGETVQEFGLTAVYTTTAGVGATLGVGAQLVENVTTYIAGEKDENDKDDQGRRFPGDEATRLEGNAGEEDGTSLEPSGTTTDPTTDTTTDPTTDTTALVPPPFPAPDDYVSAYEEHMNIMCAGLTSFMCSLASIEHVWDSSLMNTFLGSPAQERQTVLAEHFLLQPLPSVQVIIGRGESFELAVVIDEEEGVAIWDFYVAEQDIGFEVSFQAHGSENDEDMENAENTGESDATNEGTNEGIKEGEPQQTGKHNGGVVVPFAKYPTEMCNATRHVVGRYAPGTPGTVLFKWDNTNSLVRGRTLHRIVEVVDQNMLQAATRAAEDEERMYVLQQEEHKRNQETQRALQEMNRTGGTMVTQRGGGGTENNVVQFLTTRLEAMEDMVGLMTAKRDQTSAMLMIERQNRTETELLLRDTHARLEQERKEVFVSRSKIATLNEQLERARGELVQQTSLAVDRAARLKTMDVEFTTLRREHDVLLDEKRAWTFSKLDLEAKTEEARVVTQLREKIADVEDLLTSRNAEVAEARRTVRGSAVMVLETV